MNTDKIDLDEIEAKMGLIEKMMHELGVKLSEEHRDFTPEDAQIVVVKNVHMRAMIRAIRAAIAERDEGDMSPFGMSKLAELRDALRPFRKDDGA